MWGQTLGAIPDDFRYQSKPYTEVQSFDVATYPRTLQVLVRQSFRSEH